MENNGFTGVWVLYSVVTSNARSMLLTIISNIGMLYSTATLGDSSQVGSLKKNIDAPSQ